MKQSALFILCHRVDDDTGINTL